MGVSYAGVVEAAKGQMLAGGAIVVGYGVISAVIGFIISLVIAYKINRRIIIKLNILLAIFIAGFWAYYQIKYQQRQDAKKLEKENLEQTRTQDPIISTLIVHQASFYSQEKMISKALASLGMFSPNYNENAPLYFYGNPYQGKLTQEPLPYDSITFSKVRGQFDIATAPPWLVPHHLKMDYGILLFEVNSITNEYIEITVNKVNNQTAYVSRDSGTLSYWPEFLLSVHSVEFPASSNGVIYAKPLNSASPININNSFMKPLRISQDWMYVELQDDNFESVGKGWVKWIQDGKLLIKYSLFS